MNNMKNMQQLFQQAQAMQKQIEDAQAKMTDAEFIGKAGGGMVQVTINGKGEMKKVTIDPSLLAEDEKEVLEDLVVAAFNDAKRQAEGAFGDAMSGITGGLMPSDMKLPF